MRRLRQFLCDDRAQALTEFAVVGPVVLFVFFAAFQFIAIWNVQVMVDYAAFCAARSVAVQEARVGPGVARILARASAAMALMSVSKPVQGEVPLYVQQLGGGSVLNALKSKAKLEEDLLKALARSLNQVTGDGNGNAAMVDKMGWLLAAWGRINTGSPATSLSYGKQSAGGLTEVTLEVRYDYPLFIPGFADFWNFLTGPDMDSVFTRKGTSVPFYFHTLRSKTAMGYEDFSRNFENNPPVNNPFADKMQADQERIKQLNKEIIQLTQEFNQAKQQRDQCPSSFKSMGFDSAQSCTAFFTARMNDLESHINAKKAELDSIMPKF